MTVLGTLAVPHALAMIQRPRAHAAARYLASRLIQARTEAVLRSATVALRLTRDPGGVSLEAFVDGNRNGVRARDIENGIDPSTGEPIRLTDLFPGVALTFSTATGVMSFTAVGTSTSGSIYLRGADGSEYCVRVLGATARTRVLRYESASREWTEVL
jgi:Tfp pilus assembly protein FimT